VKFSFKFVIFLEVTTDLKTVRGHLMPSQVHVCNGPAQASPR